jgi:hypothetical protein
MLGGLKNFNNGGMAGELSTSQFGLQRPTSGGAGPSNGDWNDLAAKASIKAAHEKVNRLIKEARQAIDDVKLSIQMSNDRMQDRTMEEAKLKKVAQTEIEVTQAIALLPYSKDMYEYKVQQLNGVAHSHRRLLPSVESLKS